MKTTELFAELLVIGIGGCALIATLLLIAARLLIGHSTTPRCCFPAWLLRTCSAS